MRTNEKNEKNEKNENTKKMLPKMNSLQEEREFWDSVPNALDFSSPIELDLDLPKRSKKRLVTMRLSEEQINLMKRLADAQDKKYQTMARDWLNERLCSEIRKMKRTSLPEKKRA